MNRIASASNTLAPAIVVLESLGFSIKVKGKLLVAVRGEDEYVAEDPLLLLGLVKLIEVRGWKWGISDEKELDRIFRDYLS